MRKAKNILTTIAVTLWIRPPKEWAILLEPLSKFESVIFLVSVSPHEEYLKGYNVDTGSW